MKNKFYITKNDYQLIKEIYPNDYLKILEKIEKGYPIQYAIGYVNFYGNKINVNKKVLIPRFETELLVEKSVKLLKNDTLNVLDIGTGSGCIAITLKKQLPKLQVDAIDISQDAIDIAQRNANENNVDITFINKSIEDIPIKKYDVIISNPPYISKEDKIDKNVKKYEPHIALFALEEGLFFYKAIIKKSLKILNSSGYLIFEIGHNQAEKVKSIITNYYPNAAITVEQDYNKKDRFVFVKLNK